MVPDTDSLSTTDVESMIDWLQKAPPLLQPPPGVSQLDQLLKAVPVPDEVVTQVHADYQSQPDRRLGKLFELLCRAIIGLQPHLQLLAHNLVIQQQRTLGELDLLIRDKRDGRICHVELTLKFYLGLRNGFWPGPNPADSLEKKWQHLAGHQFPLPRRTDLAELLQRSGIPTIDHQYLFSRGQLFYPAGMSLDTPPQASPAHLRGRWWRTTALPRDSTWQLVPRHQWLLAGQLLDNGSHHLASTEVFDYVQQRKRPQMVIRHGSDGSRDNAFIVPDKGWPNEPG